jgi:sulfide:quinone oxidoreductase
MAFKKLTNGFVVSAQITESDIIEAAKNGFVAIIGNRPDSEDAGQQPAEVTAGLARKHGLKFVHIPVTTGAMRDGDVAKMAAALAAADGPVLAYCRSGTRATLMWALAQAGHIPAEEIFAAAARAGVDITPVKAEILQRAGRMSGSGREAPSTSRVKTYDVVVVGGGSAGIATAASLLQRRASLAIAIVEPAEMHYYQPGWTLVGAGVFKQAVTGRPMANVMPDRVTWVRQSASGFSPESNEVVLADGSALRYRVLVAAPGLKLNWDAIPGLSAALGKHGVTSNYRYDLAPYTHELASTLRRGRALFTQPPMPIKCAGAPQKAMYLSCDTMRRAGTLKNVEVEFHNAGAVLFGVPAYVPALMKYIERYNINLRFESKLVAVEGAAKVATFERKGPDGKLKQVQREFDMLHAVPPQVALDFVAKSPLAAESGFIAVDSGTLQHPRYPNVYSLGDACATTNAKTAAAARKQAPVVAMNVLATLDGGAPAVFYDGYGSCPLTVERGKIVLAEFGYGGKLMPSFPAWALDGTTPTRAAWFLKDRGLPFIYWHGMLKGREWLAKPQPIRAAG